MFKSLEKKISNTKSYTETNMLKRHLHDIQREMRELDDMIHVKMNKLMVKEKKMETLRWKIPKKLKPKIPKKVMGGLKIASGAITVGATAPMIFVPGLQVPSAIGAASGGATIASGIKNVK